MKKILLTVFAFTICATIYGQSKRTALVEEFTQASCPPCETSTPYIDEAMALNGDNVVQIRYQTSWPGVDPMNADNPIEVQARVDYYDVGGVPNAFMDGSDTESFPDLVPASLITETLANDAPILVTVSHELAADETSLTLNVQIVNEGTEAYTMNRDRLRVALTEQVISFNSPPGSTSITHFEGVMKTFFTGTNGLNIPEIAAGDTWEMSWVDEDITGINIYDMSQLEVVAFVQDDETNAIINAGTSVPKVVADYTNLGIVNTSENNSLCDYNFVPVVTVTNPGRQVVNEYQVVFNVNDIEFETLTITDPIAVGASAEIAFNNLDLPPGNNNVYYEVIAPDDLGTFNNVSGSASIGKLGGATSSLSSGFETEEIGAPANSMIIETPYSLVGFVLDQATLDAGFGAASNPTTAIGGYAMSENSIIVPFWYWSPVPGFETASITVIDQVEVTSDMSAIGWDWAYTPYTNTINGVPTVSEDVMAVQISTDCGDTFATLWERAGSEMMTAPQVNGGMFFSPNADQWESAQVDLSSYIGQEVVVRFEFTTAFGDFLYLDNINTEALSSIDDLDQDESIDLYPNPAVNEITLDMNINEASDVNIRIVNVLGETVLVDRMESVSGNSRSTIDVSDMVAGAYVVYMTVGDKEVVRRISVAK